MNKACSILINFVCTFISAELFHIFWPFLLPKSLQFANGDDARSRRHQYGRAMTYNATNRYIGHIQEVWKLSFQYRYSSDNTEFLLILSDIMIVPWHCKLSC